MHSCIQVKKQWCKGQAPDRRDTQDGSDMWDAAARSLAAGVTSDYRADPKA